jgi:cytochrome c-type biogenesis protein CcmH
MRAFLLLVALAWPVLAHAQAEEIARPNPVVEERLKRLAEELRCLVCQNQTIADSSAPLALDLRNQIRTQVAAGRSDDEIRAYMVDRYGDFVLYRPPFKATTVVLWLGPLLLIVIGGAVFFAVVRRRRGPVDAPSGGQPRAEIEALLDEPPRPTAQPGAPANGKR